MKMIYVGSLAANPDRDSHWIRSFQELGHDVITFCSSSFHSSNKLISKVQKRFHVGYANANMQKI